tara:strand:+ start:44 stop:304 length:261 start_codon:yes stop_codon:yes gene_type:complete
MNYYIVTKETFELVDKSQVHFMRKNLDKTKRLIATTENVEERIRKFNNINTCSSYTFTNHSDWVGDGTGIDLEELEEGGYISEVDD